MSSPNFLDKLTGKKSNEPQSFLALVLSDQRVQAAVWRVVDTITEIVSLGTPVEWDGEVATTSELVQAVDATISSATEGLEVDPEKVVLGLSNTWVENKGIKSSKKDLIKNICSELSLDAIGYVVISDTIVKYLKMQEGSPLSSLLIQIDLRSAILSLVELGHIKHTVNVTIGADIGADIARGIKELPLTSPMPSRFILVSAMENTSDLVQALTAYDWNSQFEFLHTPKIEALPKDIEVHATAVAGGSEVAASLGFSIEPEPIEPSIPQPILSGEDVGFSVGELSPVAEQVEVMEEPKKPLNLPHITLPKFKLKKLSLPKFMTIPKRPIVNILILLISVVSISIALLYLVPRAIVSLEVQVKPVVETVSLTLSSNLSALDIESQIVPAKYSNQSISGQDSIPVTGQKTIGDSATGEVIIYNRTTLPKTFLKGTVLTADSLKFSLDSDVTVASKSAGVDYVDMPGKASVKITANSFGTSGNLASNSEFTLASFSKDSYVAKNEKALAGGSSQEITVVSEEDQETLIKSLSSKLIQELSDSLKIDTTSTQSYYVLDNDIKIISEDYSSEVGASATSLTVDLTLTVGVLTYDQEDVQTLVKSAIDKSIPDNYIKADISPTIELENATVDDNQDVSASAKVTLYLIPKIDTDNLTQLIKGKKYSQARSILTDTVSGVVGVNIKLTPNLPPRLVSLPLNKAHIQIGVVPIK